MDCCGEWLERNHHLSLPCTIILGASKNGNMKETDAPKVHCTGILQVLQVMQDKWVIY
jgi:hypothetical protein